MRLSIKGLAAASAVIWGGAILLVIIGNIIWPGYGSAFLQMADSIYPGYDMEGGAMAVISGTLYGAICGAIFAWVYNLFAS